MRQSSILGSSWNSRWFAGALLIGAAALSAGCSKDQPAGTESPTKEPQREEQAKSTPEGVAPGAPTTATAATEPGADKAQDAPAAAAEGQPGAAAKVDPTKISAAGKPAVPGQPEAVAAAETAAPAPPGAAADAKMAEPAAPAPTSAAGDTRGAEVTSPKVGEANFSVWMQSAGKHKAGQQGVVEVVLIPKNGFKCNDNYPYKIKLSDPPAGVSYPQPIVRKEGMSVSPQRGVMRVPFVASAAGDARIAGKFSFSVCTSDQCLIDSRDLAITVKVE